MKVKDLIDVPDFSSLNQILRRMLYKVCKGTLKRVRDLIDVPDFSLCLVRSS